jgi:hypothetical protein
LILDKCTPEIIYGSGRLSLLLPEGVFFLKHLPVVPEFPEVVGERGDGIGNYPTDNALPMSVL